MARLCDNYFMEQSKSGAVITAAETAESAGKLADQYQSLSGFPFLNTGPSKPHFNQVFSA